MAHRSELFTYRAVAHLTPRSHRPVYRKRYAASCSCGWSADFGTFIAAARGWRKHRDEVRDR